MMLCLFVQLPGPEARRCFGSAPHGPGPEGEASGLGCGAQSQVSRDAPSDSDESIEDPLGRAPTSGTGPGERGPFGAPARRWKSYTPGGDKSILSAMALGARMEQEPRQPEGDAPDAENRLVRLSLFFYGAMMAAALIWRVGFYGEPIFFFSEQAAIKGMSLGRDAANGLGVGLLTVALSRLWTEYSASGDRMGRAMAQALGPLSGPHALLLALASGMGEELFFRGALQPRVGWVAASLLFGAVHFVPRRDMLPWTGFAVVMGGVLGGLFEWTGNLVAPIVAHTVINGLNLPFLVKRYRRDSV